MENIRNFVNGITGNDRQGKGQTQNVAIPRVDGQLNNWTTRTRTESESSSTSMSSMSSTASQKDKDSYFWVM